MVEVEQSAEAFRLHHSPFLLKEASAGKRNGILDTLVIAFGVIVRQVLPDHMLQGAFAAEDELLHTFRLDDLHEPLRKRIQVQGEPRKFHDRDTVSVQNPVKRSRVFRIAAADR